ncbi:MAG: hypothetical protein ACKOAR_12780 [Bacteroidota bacterium]
MKQFLFLLFSISVFAASAQSFEDIKTKDGLALFETKGNFWFLRYTTNSGKFVDRLSVPTVNYAMRRFSIGKGERSYSWEYPAIGDVLSLLWRRELVTSNMGATLTSVLVGWHQATWNVVSGQKTIIAPGISFGDYTYASGREPGTNPNNVYEPFGWFLAAGGALRISQMINNDLWIDLEGRYDKSWVTVTKKFELTNPIDKYPRPDFMALTLTVNHSSRLFAAVRMVNMIDNGDIGDKATRIDLSLGYRAGRNYR